MTRDLPPFQDDKFSDATAQLERLLSNSNHAFLLGAGCSRCAGLPLMDKLTADVCNSSNLCGRTKRILKYIIQQFEGSTTANIEDYMSVLVDILSIEERRSNCGTAKNTIRLSRTEYSVVDLRNALAEIKSAIAQCIEGNSISLSIHRRFIRAIHSTLQSGKSTNQSIVDYFTLNYDTLLEDALALERIPYVDGFYGGATGWWDQGCFNQKNTSARVFKIHGSIDWCLLEEDDVLPRRVRPNVALSGALNRVMIWPAATKYREAQRDPYAQMISEMKRTLRPNDGCEVVLAICGYRFGDSHINMELDQALRESEQRLTIIAFTSENEPTGQLKDWAQDPVIYDQVCIYANRGFYHGNDQIRSNVDLPWWNFEILTRLLEGER